MGRILLLAGTGNARRFAARLAGAGHDVVASLAGATNKPAAYPCATRTGGFGGVDGLCAYLGEQRPDAIVDATHPFAQTMSAHAIAAARRSETPLFALARPEWTKREGETWRVVPDIAAAAAALPRGAAAFLATGRGTLAAFAKAEARLYLRVVDPPREPFPYDGDYVVARPPFDEAAERALFQRLGVGCLVVKNAGGAAGRAKLDAAASLGLDVIVVDRPPPLDGAPPPMSEDALLEALRDI